MAYPLHEWVAQVCWDVLLNRAGTTFRKLQEARKSGLDAARAIQLMLAQNSMIKRPELEAYGTLQVGFRPDIYAARLRALILQGAQPCRSVLGRYLSMWTKRIALSSCTLVS